MKLKKFRIKNYKSIVDSGDCYLTDAITIFAGKNESGKTSILEALEDFNTSRKIRDNAKPIKSKEVPEISITFVIKKETLKEILEKVKIPIDEIDNVEMEIIKMFPDEYSFNENTLKNKIFDDEKIKKIREDIRDKWGNIKIICNEYEVLDDELFEIDFSNLDYEKIRLIDFKNMISPNLSKITDEKKRELFSKLLNEIQINIDNIISFSNNKTKFLEELKKRIPNFILFNSFEDIFPNKIPFSELEENEWIQDLSVISNLKIDIIKGTNDRGKEKHKDDVNIRLNNDYKKFWTQDVSNLSINWDSEYLYFWIKEDGYPFEPSLRSKGRQWHLAFYIKISARANENRSNIILIDEPGLFLHARAQKDILKKLEDSAKEVQLIFSTHSPYLLEADKLNRIRLIKRFNDTGTRIENNFHALADKETLTPILTSIGFELNAGIFAVDKSNNIIVEGPSDKFYLDAFKKILNRNNLNFIYGGGSGNMPIVGTILHGWGVNVVYLYDNDKGKKDGEKNLKNNWSISENLILTVLETTGSIEDIFSQYDFKKFVLNNPDVDYSEANSKYVKENKLNKVLLSKKFLEICQGKVKIELDETTINKITELFDKIESKFTDFHITTDEEK